MKYTAAATCKGTNIHLSNTVKLKLGKPENLVSLIFKLVPKFRFIDPYLNLNTLSSFKIW